MKKFIKIKKNELENTSESFFNEDNNINIDGDNNIIVNKDNNSDNHTYDNNFDYQTHDNSNEIAKQNDHNIKIYTNRDDINMKLKDLLIKNSTIRITDINSKKRLYSHVALLHQL